MSRVFGVITDTGMFDPFKLEQIQHSMNKVRVNLEQLRSGERVQAGRTNLPQPYPRHHHVVLLFVLGWKFVGCLHGREGGRAFASSGH